MKTKVLVALLTLLTAVLLSSCGKSEVKIDEKHFPDKIFRQYVADNFDITGDGYLNEDEISRVHKIYVEDMGIYYLDGIEYFTSLIRLNCSHNLISNLDCVNKCTQLSELFCAYNPLVSLDVSKCTQLEWLECYNCTITNLNVSKCIQMWWLDCDHNSLTTIDVKKCAGLRSLSCEYNDLTSLDVSNCTLLKTLDCSNNSLSNLDISNCLELTGLRCRNNNISILNIGNRKLSSFEKDGFDSDSYYFECDPDVEIIN